MSALTKGKGREIAGSFRLAIVAVERCRELLVNADADADDLAEYDAATEGLRCTLEEWLAPAIANATGGSDQ